MDTMLARKKEDISTSELDIADVLHLSNEDFPLNSFFFYKNFKIYSTTVRSSDVSMKRWAVQSKANAERQAQGFPTSGDRLAKTAQEAIDIVEELLRQEASRARLIANAAQCEARDISVLQGFKSDKSQIERERAYAVLMKIEQGKSRVQFVIDAVNSSHQFAAVRVFDPAAKAKDQKTMDAVLYPWFEQ